MKGRVALVASMVVAIAAAAARADEPVSTPNRTTSSVDGPPRPPAPPARDAGPLVSEVYARGPSFCKDAEFPLAPEEVAWCDLVPQSAKAPDPRCPRLVEACAHGARAQLAGRQRVTMKQLELPFLGGIGTFVGYALIALIVVGAVVLVMRLLGQLRAAEVGRAADERDDDGPKPDFAAREAARRVETDVERLLARARAAAAAGDFSRGVADAYAALLRKLEGTGVVRVEPNRTNGDHLRDVARRLPAAEPDMRPIVRAVERAQFGGVAPDEAGFRFVLDGVVRLLAERLSSALPALLVMVGLALGVAGCSSMREAWDDSPSGQAAVLQLLRKYGFEAHERLSPLAKLGAKSGDAAAAGDRSRGVDVLVLEPDVEMQKEDWTTLDTWVADGGTLVVAGAGRELPDWIPAKLAAGAKVSAPLEVSAGLAPWFTGHGASVPPGPALEITRAAAPPATSGDAPQDDRRYQAGDVGDDDDGDDDDDDAPTGLWPLLERAGKPYAAEGFHGDGRVVVLADDRLFTNVALLVPDDAALLTDLLRRDGQRVEIADDLTGLVSPNPLASVSRGRLAAPLLQLALVVSLFFAARGAHFGRPRDPVVSRRRAFAEHARALGVQYARGRAARYALWLYGGFALDRLRERLHLAGGKSLSAVAEAVASRAGRPIGDVMRVLVDARDPEAPASTGPGVGSSRSVREDAIAAQKLSDLATLREIATLLSQTGGAGERTRVQGQG
ncbi:MAG TPA: DUF4350 domain-containing protein [Polyangia bacterium]|nr:DUF4350 domain-containing protein [Polyangia bacterium]